MNNLEPSVLVIFGVTGDLSRRYLLPALYHLCKDGLLPEQFVVVGTSRQQLELDEFLGNVELCVLEQDNVCDPEVLKQLRSLIRLVQLDPVQADDYRQLYDTLEAIEAEQGVCMNRLYYLSIPPQIYEPVVQNLGEQGLNGSCSHGKALTRLVIEKPFGYDETSAGQLIENTGRWFGEDQIFRIDHYLAKETVQDILLFRQRNPAYEAIWNGGHISRVDIVAYESIDVQGRAFYDQIGALRDLVQSHLLQLLALVLMELPAQLTSESIHHSKEQLLQAIGSFPADKVAGQTLRGQYDGYREQIDNADSTTETFAALHLRGPGSRWKATDITISTGKALPDKRTAITVHFHNGRQVCFRIQPKPGIEAPASPSAVTDFSDVERPVNHAGADAYERVIIDAIRGDQTLFASSREVLACWHILQPVLNEWSKGSPRIVPYTPGTTPELPWEQ